MPKSEIEFSIDDTQSFETNQQKFNDLLEQLDPELSKAMRSYFEKAKSPDPADLWDHLLEAIASKNEEKDTTGDGEK